MMQRQTSCAHEMAIIFSLKKIFFFCNGVSRVEMVIAVANEVVICRCSSAISASIAVGECEWNASRIGDRR